MLEKLGKLIMKYKGALLLAMMILFAVTVVGTVFLVTDSRKINSDMVSYLDDESTTKRGLVFLKEEFDIRGNATLVVRVDETDANDVAAFNTAVGNVEKMKSVSAVTWYGSISSYEQIDGSINGILNVLHDNRDYLKDLATTLKNEGVYKDADKLILLLDFANAVGSDFVDTSDMESYLRHETSEAGVYDYVILVLTDIDAGDGAYELLDNIKAEFWYTEYASTGTTETSKRLLAETMEDLPWFIVCGVLSVLLILLLTTSSFIEPFILIATLGVGIVVSMGMNYLFPSISIISFALSAVLQLAITMDYAIFYMHIYKLKRAEFEPDVAAAKAFPAVAESVVASGLTTVGGFAALYCMEFKIGTDMANVLIKGVLMSMLTVLILQPVLMFFADKTIIKTTHGFTARLENRINASREKKGKRAVKLEKQTVPRQVARFAVWQRIVLIVIAVGLIVPCFLAQSRVKYSYLELYEKKLVTHEDILADGLGNQLILAVPVRVSKENASQKDFIAAVKNVNKERISGMLGAFTAIDVEEDKLEVLLDVLSADASGIKKISEYLNNPKYATVLEEYGIEGANLDMLRDLCGELESFSKNVDFGTLSSFFRRVDGEWYTLYTVSFGGNTEDEEAQAAYAEITKICREFFGKDRYYPVGLITSSYEMAAITPHDFLVVTLVSAAIIFAIVTVLLRNPVKSLIIIVIIELGIWLNLAISYLLGQSINFIVYVIISSVQLGCTVDYAILFANTFEKNRSSFDNGKACASATAAEVIPPILTSALMMGAVCFGMFLISGNIIIRQLTGMLARGAIINLALVALVQTAVWSFFKTERRDRGYEEKLLALEQTGVEENAPSIVESKPKKKKLSAAEKLALLEEQDKK